MLGSEDILGGTVFKYIWYHYSGAWKRNIAADLSSCTPLGLMFDEIMLALKQSVTF